MEKEIIVNDKKDDSYKLVLRVELNEDDELLMKRGLNLLALSPKLDDKKTKMLETLFGYYWYKQCEIKILKKDEQNLQRAKIRFVE